MVVSRSKSLALPFALLIGMFDPLRASASDEHLRLAAAARQEGGAEASFESVSRAVIRLETRKNVGATPPPIATPAGTGFLVAFNGALYLVSARHVTEVAAELWARVPKRQESGMTAAELWVPRDAWVRHPSKKERRQRNGSLVYVGAADVAATRVPWPSSGDLGFLVLCSQTSSCTAGDLGAEDPRPPQRLLVLGYPDWLGFELEIQRPLLRSGVVAMATREPTLKYLGGKLYAREGTLALDVRSFPGNSGSPVFLEASFAESPALVGLISSGDEGLDFAMAEPISRIIETLLLAETTPVTARPAWTPEERDSANSVSDSEQATTPRDQGGASKRE